MGICVTARKPLPTIQQTIVQMKLAAKRFYRQSAKAFQEQAQQIKKAKVALNKNNEQGAKMYLQAAASKHIQGNSLQRMGLKMETLTGTIKNSHSNEIMVNNFVKLTQVMSTKQNQPNIQFLAQDYDRFQSKMDELMINSRVMQKTLNKGSDTQITAQSMMQKLKLEMALQTQGQIISQAKMRFQAQNLTTNK